MKILHIATTLNGGAGRSTVRLHKALLSNGVDSKILFLIGNEDNVEKSIKFSQKKSNSFINIIIKKILNQFNINVSRSIKNKIFLKKIKEFAVFDIFTFPVTDYRIHELECVKNADIINLHWVANFIDWPSFFENIKLPIVWTFHDRNPILGGVHLEIDYYRNSNKFKEIDNYYRKIKMTSIFKTENLSIVCPSKSLLEIVEKNTSFDKFKKYNIANSIDENQFKYLNSNCSKKVLGFNENDIIITFVGSIAFHKGFDLLLASILLLNDANIQFIVIGVKKNKYDLESLPKNIHFWETINDDRLLAIIYSASSATIITSREDNLPNVMLESWFCGTPVLSVPIGGMLDSVKVGFNGLISEELSSESIKKLIDKFILTIDLFERKRISEDARKKYSIDIQFKNYYKLYESILSR